MKKLLAALIILAASSAAAQQQPNGFHVVRNQTPLSVTSAGQTSTLTAPFVSVLASNPGSATAYCQPGATATTSSPAISGGGWMQFDLGGAATFSCITVGPDTTTINIAQGFGPAAGGGGGSGGGGGGGGGAITAPLGPAQADAAQVAITTNPAGALGLLLSGPPNVTVNGASQQLTGRTPGTAQTGTIYSLNVDVTNFNVTPTDCSVTLTAGTTAQNAFTAQTTLHGFTIANIDTTHSEPVWFSFTTTAAAGAVGSYPLASPSATSYANLASWTSPPGFGTNHALSVVAATTGHLISCTWW